MPSHRTEFIAEMKQRLLEEKKQLETELHTLKHNKKTDLGADFPEYGRDEEDNATEVADFQALSATSQAAQERLKSVMEALERITRGTYGLTNEGELIPEERLQANPAATTLIKPSQK